MLLYSLAMENWNYIYCKEIASNYPIKHQGIITYIYMFFSWARWLTARCSHMHSGWTSHCATCPATMWRQWLNKSCPSAGCNKNACPGNELAVPGMAGRDAGVLQWHSTMGHRAWHLTSAGDRCWQQTIPTPGGWRSESTQRHFCVSCTAWCSLVISQVRQSVPISLLEPKANIILYIIKFNII